MANEAKPLFRPGADVTVKTTGAVTGKTFVAVSATPDADGLIKAATAGRGADAVLDPVGGRYAEPALRALARGGVFVTLGYASGQIPSIPLNLVLLKGVTVRGMEIRTFFTDYPDAAVRDIGELHALFAAGRVSPHIGARFPLAEAGAALDAAREQVERMATAGPIRVQLVAIDSDGRQTALTAPVAPVVRVAVPEADPWHQATTAGSGAA